MLLFANFNLKCFSLQFSSIAQLLHNMLSRNFQSIPPEEGKSAPIMKYQQFWLRICILRMPYLNSMWYNLCIPLNFHNAKLGHFILDRIIWYGTEFPEDWLVRRDGPGKYYLRHIHTIGWFSWRLVNNTITQSLVHAPFEASKITKVIHGRNNSFATKLPTQLVLATFFEHIGS